MGGGVAVLSGGTVRGGDSSMFYLGSYTISGDMMTASVRVVTHLQLPGIASVFGVPSANLTIRGKLGNGRIDATASAAEAPGIHMKATLTLIRG